MEIFEVQSRNQLNQFLDFSEQVYKNKYPRYVHPLNLQTKMLIGKLGTKGKHLFYIKNADQIVARCGFKIHNHDGKEFLHFGFFECLENQSDAVAELFQNARRLYPHLTIRGPFHFRMEDPYIGVLTEGYDLDPYFLMSYNPPYYAEYLQKAGLKKIMDLFTYELHSSVPVSPLIVENAKLARTNGYKIRFMDKNNLKKEAFTIAKIFNDALSKNWGFEEFLEDQVNEMVLMFRFFLDTRVIALVHKDGKDVGCLIMIPNFNHMIKSSKGKLCPTLILNYLKRFRMTGGEARGYALGVLKEHHGQGIGSLLVDEMYKIGPQLGYEKAEISWVLANNGPMNELSKAMNGKQNKVYGIFEMEVNAHG